MINRIVAYGCSQTLGYETEDETWFPGAEEFKRRNPGTAFWQHLKKNISDFKLVDYFESHKKNSYANKLAEKLGLTCSNRAVLGNSLPGIVWSLNNDLVNGNIVDTDLVIVGLPTRERIVHFSENKVQSAVLGFPEHWPTALQELAPQLVEHYNYELYSFQYVNYVRSLIQVEHAHLTGRLFFTETHPYNLAVHLDSWQKSQGLTDMEDSVKHTMEALYQEIRHSKYMLNEPGCTLVSGLGQDPNGQLAGGHATKEWQQTFADYIYNNIKEKL